MKTVYLLFRNETRATVEVEDVLGYRYAVNLVRDSAYVPFPETPYMGADGIMSKTDHGWVFAPVHPAAVEAMGKVAAALANS